ncbi:toxin-antitoxin system YwqK family antitoxin [Aequorivita capsosiphonis]|uniref:toxin-antitoxin system YwqK family antitoxin n=1 Tax=Aequorivita capsosiphonis TaxID=487317 RepID=UPI0004044CE2|nr:hypothetical protein [Aequorivita capsosiphonis]
MSIYLFFALSIFTNIYAPSDNKQYIKNYYENGIIKSEGWLVNNYKSGYWKFYTQNANLSSKGPFKNNKKNGYWYFFDEGANLKKEGHFVNGSAENWWIFYEIGTPYKSKIQFESNKKNGYALCYKNNNLIRAEKYKNDLKTGTWTSISAFKQDNPDASF